MTDGGVIEEVGSPDSASVADSASVFSSAYVHIPFCARVCPYCDFAVVADRGESIDRYVAAVVREIRDEPVWKPLDAVFIGGGTPTAVPAAALSIIVTALSDRFTIASDAELTVEANPEDWTPALAAQLVEAGINRVSFGAQSFDLQVLEALGRQHQPDDIARAVAVARAEGIRSISLDLIFGTPGESLVSWEATIHQAIALGIDHVSPYSLTVEPATALGRAVRLGAAAPDPDDQADKWELATRALADAGFVRYEVSNHAKPGRPCRYNLGVWAQGEYLAFGLGAHGFRDGVRTRNVRRLDTYLARVEAGIGPVQASDRIEGHGAEVERLMLGLRRTAGVFAGAGGAALLSSQPGRRLIDAGVMAHPGDRIVVIRPLLTDEVVRAVMGLPDR